MFDATLLAYRQHLEVRRSADCRGAGEPGCRVHHPRRRRCLQPAPRDPADPFGNVGDGNIHFNLTQLEGTDKTGYPARWQEFNDIVHGVVRELRGSISAE